MKRGILNFNKNDQCTIGEGANINISEVSLKDIAIIGISCKTSLADNVNELWDNVRNKVDCVREFPHNRRDDISLFLRENNYKSGYKYYNAGYLDEIDKFDYNFFGISPKEACLMDPNQRLFLEEAWKTIEDAGYGGERLKGSRTGVFLGFGGEAGYMKLIEKFEPSSVPVAFPGNLNSIIASRISYLLDLKGPSIVLDTACSSSLVAVHLACQAIKTRECSMALVGGIKLHLFPIDTGSRIGIESSDGRTRAFDENSNGTGSGEGVVAVLLKPLQRAIEDGDNVYAVIKGSSINQDGTSIGLTAPNPSAQEEVILRAWKEAGVNPEEISYIEAHGTGTKLGDPIEIEAISRAFRKFTDKKQFCAVGSIKTNVGHLDYAAGIIGLVKSVMALKHKEIPPLANFTMGNQKINFVESPVYISDRLSKWDMSIEPRRCGVSAFGMSGTNCHIILEEFLQNSTYKSVLNFRAHIFTLSAKSEEALKSLIEKYKAFAEELENVNLSDICYTSNIGRGHYNYRVAFIAIDLQDFIDKVRRLEWENRYEYVNTDFYYGRHKVVADNKELRDIGDIKENELLAFNCLVNSKVQQFIASQYKNTSLLEEICCMYVKGAQVEWSVLYKTGNTVHLPTYQFDPKRCWIEISKDIDCKHANREEDLFFSTKWIQTDDKLQGEKIGQGSILVFNDNKGKVGIIAKKLRKDGCNVIEADIGTEYRKINNNSYIISADNEEDYRYLIEDIYKENTLTQIIHMMSINCTKNTKSVEELSANLRVGIYSVFHLTRAVMNCCIKEKIDMVLITQYANEVTGSERLIIPENASLLGFGRVINLESLNISCRGIDLDDNTNLDKVIDEIKYKACTYNTSFRREMKYYEELKAVNISEVQNRVINIIDDAVYIITGGTGGLGLEMARSFAAKARVNLVLINRSNVPIREDGDGFLENAENKMLQNKISIIKEIQKTGSKVFYYNADLSDYAKLKDVLDDVRNRFGKINGIIHCAGIAGDSFIINKEKNEMEKVLAPKVMGTWILDDLSKNDRLDFFITFSSITSIFGAPGQSDYTAANAYMDSFVSQRKRNGKRTVTINWCAWKDVGMAKNAGVNKDGIFSVISTEEAVKAFESVLEKDINAVIIGRFNYCNTKMDKILFQIGLPDNMKSNLESTRNFMKVSEKTENSSIHYNNIQIKGNKDGEKYTEIQKLIANSWAEILGLKEIDINDDFFELGGNSIMALNFESDMELNDIDLRLQDLYKYKTIADLTSSLQNNIKSKELKNSNLSEQDQILSNSEDHSKFCGIRLENIEPFNDIFYKSCFYNSLFPVVRHFNRSIYPFLINDINIYKIDTRSDSLKACSSECISLKTYDELLQESGIICKYKEVSANVIDDILESIKRGRPVIIWVDCFYEPTRQDTYLKNHLPHTLLIYGYDENLKIFCIIEHTHRDSLKYKEQFISFEDVIACYKGCINNFLIDNPFPTYMEFYLDGNTEGKGVASESINNYISEFKSNIIVNKDIILKRLEILKIFIEDYKNNILNVQLLKENAQNLLEGFNNIINAKQAQLYIASKLFQDDCKDIKVLDKITNNWIGVRGIITKFSYTSIYKEDMFRLSTTLLNEIYELEQEYFSNIQISI